MSTVNITQFGEIIGKSGQYVGMLITQGMPAERSGRRGAQVFIDTAKAIAWLIERERTKVEAELAPADSTTAAATKRLRTAQADAQEIENKVRRTELIDAEDVQQVLFLVTGSIKSHLQALPGRMAASVAACQGNMPAIHAKLRDEVNRALEIMSDQLNKFAEEISPEPEPQQQS